MLLQEINGNFQVFIDLNLKKRCGGRNKTTKGNCEKDQKV